MGTQTTLSTQNLRRLISYPPPQTLSSEFHREWRLWGFYLTWLSMFPLLISFYLVSSTCLSIHLCQVLLGMAGNNPLWGWCKNVLLLGDTPKGLGCLWPQAHCLTQQAFPDPFPSYLLWWIKKLESTEKRARGHDRKLTEGASGDVFYCVRGSFREGWRGGMEVAHNVIILNLMLIFSCYDWKLIL